jgi:hypothetical protein
MDEQLDVLALDKFGIKFPKEKISYVQMTAGMPGHTIWRYFKVSLKLCMLTYSSLTLVSDSGISV